MRTTAHAYGVDDGAVPPRSCFTFGSLLPSRTGAVIDAADARYHPRRRRVRFVVCGRKDGSYRAGAERWGLLWRCRKYSGPTLNRRTPSITGSKYVSDRIAPRGAESAGRAERRAAASIQRLLNCGQRHAPFMKPRCKQTIRTAHCTRSARRQTIRFKIQEPVVSPPQNVRSQRRRTRSSARPSGSWKHCSIHLRTISRGTFLVKLPSLDWYPGAAALVCFLGLCAGKV